MISSLSWGQTQGGLYMAPGDAPGDGEVRNMNKIRVVTLHAGVACRDGGRYGEWQIWEPYRGRLIKRYYSTFIGGMCPRCGRYLRAWETLRDHPCVRDYEALTTEEVRIYRRALKEGMGILDLTGHEPVPGRLGGCVKCHPDEE